MSLNFTDIDVVDDIDIATFRRQYLKPRRPVIVRKLSRAWPAYTKWTLDYFKSVCGDKDVPLYDGSKADASKKVNEPVATMKFADYLDLIAREPTDLRIFTFNIFSNVPDLVKDYRHPDLCRVFLDRVPLMFFGGAGSKVFMHFDIDESHIFLTQFHGKKRVLLVSPQQTPRMYKLPLSFHAHEDIDWRNVDYSKWPALRGVRAHAGTIEHGDTLFMPSGWWHYMEYVEGGFAVAQRALASPVQAFRGIWNVSAARTIDNVCRKRIGQKYFDWKERAAVERSNRYAANHPVVEERPAAVLAK
jgi:hypothetical protein